MSINRAGVDAKQINVDAVVTGKRFVTIRPGEILREELLVSMGIRV